MELFRLDGKTAVVLGGAGALGSAVSRGLALAGADVAIADLAEESADKLAAEIRRGGVKARAYNADAMYLNSLKESCRNILQDFGKIDVLVNSVGGNRIEATSSDTIDFFGLSTDALKKVVSLNLFGGAILPAQVFGNAISANMSGGSIINISSICGLCPLTRVGGYSAAKSAANAFTQWLAVHLSHCGHTNLRVNAVAPGFILTEQNRFLLRDEETGAITHRGQTILDHTPMSRFGEPEDIIGAVVWLASDASKFVTGVVVPVDGGFTAFSGV